jgi:DUF4097 and DUF4098 domain-containing protein YvlB
MKPGSQKVGRVTIALGLVIFGVALLLDNLAGSQTYVAYLLKFWPILLIGLGVEYLWRSLLMERSEKEHKLKFDIGGAMILLLVIMLSSGVTIFRGWTSFGDGGRFTFAGPSVQRHEEATVPLGSAKEVQVDLGLGSVDIQTANASTDVRVEATYTAYGLIFNQSMVRDQLEQIKLNVTQGDRIVISATQPRSLNGISIHYVIYLPDGLKVTASAGTGALRAEGYKGDLKLSSSTGSTYVVGGSGSLVTNTGTGMIHVEGFTGPVNVQSNTGSIDLRDNNGPAQVVTGTGAVNVFGTQGGKLQAEARTGSIHVELNAIDGEISLKTNTGRITLASLGDDNVTVTAKARVGSLNMPPFMLVARNGAASSAMGKNGEGAYAVNLETGTGTIQYTTQGN